MPTWRSGSSQPLCLDPRLTPVWPFPTGTAPPVPPVFTNGAWDPSDPRARLNPYVTALLARDIYYKHVGGPYVSTVTHGDACRAILKGP